MMVRSCCSSYCVCRTAMPHKSVTLSEQLQSLCGVCWQQAVTAESLRCRKAMELA